MGILRILIAVSLLTGCSSTYVVKEFNKEGMPLIITINTHTKNNFIKEVREYTKVKVGEVVYSKGDSICDITVKSINKPKVDKDLTLTIGHEIMHCLYGNYH